jgi:hypothetical protein
MGERFFANDSTAEGDQLTYFGATLAAPAEHYLCLFYTHPTYGILEIGEFYNAGTAEFRNYTRAPIGEFNITSVGNTVTISNAATVNITHTDTQQWPTITHIGILPSTAITASGTVDDFENDFLTVGNTLAQRGLLVPGLVAITPKTIAIGGTAHFGRNSIRIVW